MRRYVEHKKAETAFRLWDLDSDGRVLREKVVRGLLRCAHALSEACSVACTCTTCNVLAKYCSPMYCLPKLPGIHAKSIVNVSFAAEYCMASSSSC